MVVLADAILVLAPSAVFGPDGNVEIQVEEAGPYIFRWDDAALGPQPTAEQLQAVTEVHVQAYYVGLAIAGVPKMMTATTDPLPLSVRLGDVYVSQHLNSLIQWLNGTVIPALAAAGITLEPYSVPADITTVTPSPCTVQDALVQCQNVLTKQPGWLTITN